MKANNTEVNNYFLSQRCKKAQTLNTSVWHKKLIGINEHKHGLILAGSVKAINDCVESLTTRVSSSQPKATTLMNTPCTKTFKPCISNLN